jgi:hypothetical protein
MDNRITATSRSECDHNGMPTLAPASEGTSTIRRPRESRRAGLWWNARNGRAPPPEIRRRGLRVTPDVLPDSYVDRGALDATLARLLRRRQSHIALRGESKCGKSWLRQRVIRDALIVQCRLGMTMIDVYRDALGQLV